MEWITTRRPTERDGDIAGYVLVKSSPDAEEGTYLHWSIVPAGMAWQRYPAADPGPAEPELKVGQVWRARNGKMVTIESQDDDPNYPFDGSSDLCYTPSGAYLKGVSHHEHDLIELITDVPTDVPDLTHTPPTPPVRGATGADVEPGGYVQDRCARHRRNRLASERRRPRVDPTPTPPPTMTPEQLKARGAFYAALAEVQRSLLADATIADAMAAANRHGFAWWSQHAGVTLGHSAGHEVSAESLELLLGPYDPPLVSLPEVDAPEWVLPE